jgi:AcrR family transcriptional regulator
VRDVRLDKAIADVRPFYQTTWLVKRTSVLYSVCMPRVSPEHLEARRSQIVEAALRCFARNGIHPTSMQDIFHEAGLSAGAVYRYFPTKELLVAAVVHRVLGMSRSAVGAGTPALAEQAYPGSVLDRLVDVFDDPGPGEQKDRFRLVLQIWAEAVRSPQVGDVLRASTDALRASIAAQISVAQERGQLRADLEPEPVARVLTALFEGYAFQRAMDPAIDTASYRTVARAMLEEGLRKP